MGPAGAEHLTHLRARNLRPLYIETRGQVLNRLEKSMQGRDVLDANLDDLRKYLDRGLAAGTVAVEVAHLKGFYRWLLLEGLIPADPTLRLDRPKRPPAQPRPISRHDLAAVLAVACDHIRPMLYLAAYAGLRACEIAPLRGEHLLLRDDPPILVVAEGKGGVAGAVPISPVLEPIVAVLPQRGWCFPRLDGRPGHLSRSRVCQLCNGLMHGIGITATLHQLRHFFISEVYRATHDIRVAQKLARHATSRTTDGYTYISDLDTVAAVAKVPRVI